MSPSSRILSRAGPLIELWLATANGLERDRQLLEAVQAWTGCRAVALWRFGRDSWRPVLERGPSPALPRVELVHEVLSERLSTDLLPMETALARIRRGRAGTAIVLGGLSEDAELDLIEAVLWAREAMELESTDVEPPPLPRSDGSSPDA